MEQIGGNMNDSFWVEEVLRLYKEGYSVQAAIWIVKEEKERWNKDGKGENMDVTRIKLS